MATRIRTPVPNLSNLQVQIDALVGQGAEFEERLLALESGTMPNPPIVSTPVLSDTTPNTGDTLSISSGGTASQGASPYVSFYQWYGTTVSSGKQAFAGQIGATLAVTSAMTGMQISVAKWVRDANGTMSVAAESALTTAVGGTQASAVTLSGLPANPTTVTTASIGWTLTGSGTVFCRRDQFAPAAAPNPFVLGSVTALSVGSHTVDFYVSAAGDGTDINSAVPITTYTWTIIAAATVTLNGLPASGTTNTGASISWTLTGSGVVYWRLDGVAIQAASSNPIVLSGLSVATHTIDFYISANGTGNDVTLGSPAATHTWAVAASGVVPLSQLGFPCAMNVTGGSGDYNGVDNEVVAATVRLGPYVDASGVTMDIHRVVQDGTNIVRAEALWLSPNYVPLICQHEYWMAFVIERISGETQGSSGPDAECLVWQTHWTGYGDTQPEIALFDNGQGTQMRWRASGSSTDPGDYADHGGSGTNNWHDTGEAGYTNPWITAAETQPAAGVKWRYVVRYKPGWESGHDKVVQIWRGKPGEAMENITTGVTYTGVNAYNDAASGASLPSYPRKGLYKYSGVAWPSATVGYRISRIYFGEGTSLYDRAVASVSWAA